MAKRNNQRVRDELRRVVGFSAADEISKLNQLRNQGLSPLTNMDACVTGWSSG